MKRLALLLLFCLSLPALANDLWSGPDGKPLTDTDSRQAKRGFSGALVITADRDWAMTWADHAKGAPAIAQANASGFGNGAAIFTASGRAAREFKHRVKAGMVGINVGVPATMAMFPFTGWDDSFYGDLHIQGKEAVQFYTQQKVVTTRWFGGEVGDVWKK